MRLKVHPAPRADFVILTYLDFWYAPVSSSSLGQIIIWGVFLGGEIEAESKSLGRGGGKYIVLHLHSYSYKISHPLQERYQSSLWVFFKFRLFGMLGFCTTDQTGMFRSAGKRPPWGVFFFLSSRFCCKHILTHSFLFFKLLYARIDGVPFPPSPGGLFVCVFLA